MALTRGVFVVAAKRTPFGAFGGKVKDVTATTLQEHAAKAALAAGNIRPEIVDSVVIGNCIQSSTDAAYLARHAALRCGVPQEVPAYTINRLCGSGFQSVVCAAQEIQLSEADVVLTGGTENMSQAPYAIRDVRFGMKFGAGMKVDDTLWGGLTDEHINTPMAITAETLAEKYGISRKDCEEYAMKTQKRWKEANDGGVFKAEMVPIPIKSKKGVEQFQTDEHPRETTAEGMAKLPPVFKKDGTVTAATASGVCDGAGAVILASGAAVEKHRLLPLARVIGYHVSGCDPREMGLGPVFAIRKLLEKTKHKLDDIDLVDVNEAFAAQYLAVEKELGLNPYKTNVNGGAIALGHPLAASGSRITAHLVHELRRRRKRLAIGSACIGGGQGIAVLLEACH